MCKVSKDFNYNLRKCIVKLCPHNSLSGVRSAWRSQFHQVWCQFSCPAEFDLDSPANYCRGYSTFLVDGVNEYPTLPYDTSAYSQVNEDTWNNDYVLNIAPVIVQRKWWTWRRLCSGMLGSLYLWMKYALLGQVLNDYAHERKWTHHTYVSMHVHTSCHSYFWNCRFVPNQSPSFLKIPVVAHLHIIKVHKFELLLL